MTREIKFRAWDGKNMRYPNLVSTLSAPNYYTCYCTDDTDPGHFDTDDIMQYTGLKDKNGKEIYEGDIIKGLLTLEGNDNYDFTDVVTYKAPCFLCENNADFGLEIYDTLEVIGNVFENPELLK